MKKKLKACAYDLFMCAVAGSEIVVACSLAKYIVENDKLNTDAIGCATVCTVSGSVLLANFVEKLIKDIRSNERN